MAERPSPYDARLTPYQRRLFVLLGVASFFDGYDMIALSQVLPALRSEMGFGKDAAGLLFSVVNLGTVLAFFLVRRADDWGRKRLLTMTIGGYTVFTLLSGFAPELWSFALLQLCARVFVIAELATSMVIVVEEYPAARRGMVIGVVSAFSAVGAVACAACTPLLLKSEFGWRMVYWVAAAPLLLLAYARRNLRETARFMALDSERPRQDFGAIWRTPYRGRLLLVALVWFLVYCASINAVSFFKDYALSERGYSEQLVGQRIIVAAAVVSMPLTFAAGRLLDALGRRPGAGVIFGALALGICGTYTLHDPIWVTVALTLAMFGAAAVIPVMNAFNTELFPTSLRGDALAWGNNVLGRIGYVVSPLVVGGLAADAGYGKVIAATAILPLAAAVLVWALPETNQRELEELELSAP